ncbi:hypothetical protein ACFWPK_28580 [Nocardia sp. NPDC058519]|uniref:hypothetical protein n=1 Tax=Nocardia sp. NPDC058519 TaxID=3346535 RepID=UPI00364BAE36
MNVGHGSFPAIPIANRMRILTRSMILMVAAAIFSQTACGISDDGRSVAQTGQPSKTDSEGPSGGPGIAHLSYKLLLPESEFPSGGKFHLSPIAVITGLDTVTDRCDPSGWVKKGDQETAANVTFDSSSLRYNVELFAVGSDPGLIEWSATCLPRTVSGSLMRAAKMEGVPKWAVAIENSKGDKTTFSVFGYFRGILVHTYVSGSRSDVTAGVQSIAPRMFNMQISRLESE